MTQHNNALTAANVVKLMELEPLPDEGGFFRETYRSKAIITTARGARATSTAIYYFLNEKAFSMLHRLQVDEVWHFYGGNTVRMLLIDEAGIAKEVLLGNDLARGERPQLLVPAGTWQGAQIEKPTLGAATDWSLVGCTCAPGFQLDDFEMADGQALSAQWPSLAPLIREFTS